MAAKKKKTKLKKTLLVESIVLAILLIVLGFQLYFDNQTSKSMPNALHKKPINKTASSSTLVKTASTAIKQSTPSAKLAVAPLNYGRSVRVPILMYHYIGNNPNPADFARNVLETAPDKFDEQMGYLQSSGFTPITLDTLYAGLKGQTALPARPIVLTFDDGYIDFFINAYPILRKYGFHAVSFIPTGLMNQGYYLSWAQIKEMQSSGLISFEAHTIGHVNLPALNPTQVRYQVTESKKVLESEIGVPVNFFAYPYGASNGTDWEIVKESGFLGAVGTWYGVVESEGTQYDWPRVRITGGISLEQYKKLF